MTLLLLSNQKSARAESARLAAVFRHRKEDADGGALWIRVNVDPSVVVEYRTLHNWKSEAHSAGLGCAERGKDFIFQIDGDSAAIILHCDHDPAGVIALAHRLGGEDDFCLRLTVSCLGRIGDEMSERFRQSRFISDNLRQIVGHRHFH
jgi:hypothetical protein